MCFLCRLELLVANCFWCDVKWAIIFCAFFFCFLFCNFCTESWNERFFAPRMDAVLKKTDFFFYCSLYQERLKKTSTRTFLYYAALVENGANSIARSLLFLQLIIFEQEGHLAIFWAQARKFQLLSRVALSLTFAKISSHFSLTSNFLQNFFIYINIYMRYFKEPRTSVGASQIFRTFKLDSILLFFFGPWQNRWGS